MGRARIIGRAVRWTGVVLGAALLLFALTPLGRYLVRAAIAEAEILAGRRPIDQVIRDPSTSDLNRRKLQLVLEARSFAERELGLSAGKSFTQYTELGRDTLVLVLSAAPKDMLVQHRWWFPVVGRLPYKGFFDFAEARDEARRMEAGGFDVNLRPAAAFSTLGWFNDPLLSTTLRADSVDLVDTVIHELTHNTFFAKGETTFNESFANFVGARGSAQFFRARDDTVAARIADEQWHDQQVLGRFWARLYAQLDSLFNLHASDRERRLAVRDSFYVAARRTMVDSVSREVLGIPLAYFERARLDNAVLLARRVYATDLEVFDRVYELEGRDVRRSIERVLAIARGAEGSVGAAVRAWVAAQPANHNRGDT